MASENKLTLPRTRTLFISSYNDTITEATLTNPSPSSNANKAAYELTKTHTSGDSKPNPAWLSQLPSRNLVVSLNEGLDAPQGSVSTFQTNFSPSSPDDGARNPNVPVDGSAADHETLKHIDTTPCLSGPVSSCFYAKGAAMAAAHYSGSGVTTWRLVPGASAADTASSPSAACRLEHLQTLTLPPFPQPGPVKDRQQAPHPHQVLLDPSGKFLLVPDLGADLVRVFSWNESAHSSLGIEECGEPLRVKPGTGPRHGVFWSPSGHGVRSGGDDVTSDNNDVYFYLVGELDSSLTAYRVVYCDRDRGTSGGTQGAKSKGLRFAEVFKTSTFGPHDVPEGNAAAEIAVCPDNKTLIISNRNTLTSSPSNHEQKTHNDPSYPIDNLALFRIINPGSDSGPDSSSHESNDDSEKGKLSFSRLLDAGGRFPRHFSVEPFGRLVAVGSQLDQRVVILRLEDGEEVARLDVGGDLTCVVWAEH